MPGDGGGSSPPPDLADSLVGLEPLRAARRGGVAAAGDRFSLIFGDGNVDYGDFKVGGGASGRGQGTGAVDALEGGARKEEEGREEGEWEEEVKVRDEVREEVKTEEREVHHHEGQETWQVKREDGEEGGGVKDAVVFPAGSHRSGNGGSGKGIPSKGDDQIGQGIQHNPRGGDASAEIAGGSPGGSAHSSSQGERTAAEAAALPGGSGEPAGGGSISAAVVGDWDEDEGKAPHEAASTEAAAREMAMQHAVKVGAEDAATVRKVMDELGGGSLMGRIRAVDHLVSFVEGGGGGRAVAAAERRRLLGACLSEVEGGGAYAAKLLDKCIVSPPLVPLHCMMFHLCPSTVLSPPSRRRSCAYREAYNTMQTPDTVQARICLSLRRESA